MIQTCSLVIQSNTKIGETAPFIDSKGGRWSWQRRCVSQSVSYELIQIITTQLPNYRPYHKIVYPHTLKHTKRPCKISVLI